MDDRSKSIESAAEGTCEWLFSHETYKSWAGCDRERGLLWIKGKPGSGKSTLLRYAIDHVLETPDIDDGALILSFFFHGRGAELEKTPLGLFQSLFYQLLRRVPDSLTDLVADFQQWHDTSKPDEERKWHLAELKRFFKSSLRKVLESRSVWLLIDALDEIGQTETTMSLVTEFKSLLKGLPKTGLQFRVCFTCRQYPVLDIAYPFEICLENENGPDISIYV